MSEDDRAGFSSPVPQRKMSASMLQLLRKYPHHVAELIAGTTLHIVALHVFEVGCIEVCMHLKVIMVQTVT
jgi:hypothetical protein